MPDPAQSIADKLIAAAYELYGRPPEPGGEYIAAVTAKADVPAYFLNRLELARLRAHGSCSTSCGAPFRTVTRTWS